MKIPEEMHGLEEIILERVRIRAMAHFSHDLIQSCTVDQVAGLGSHDLWTAMLDILVPAKKTVHTTDAEKVPLTWWDHFKSSIGRKHKTRSIPTEETHYHVCPHVNFGFRGRDQLSQHLGWMNYASNPALLARDIEREADDKIETLNAVRKRKMENGEEPKDAQTEPAKE